MRSRLMGIVTMCIGTAPLGQLAAGAISDALGPRSAVIIMAVMGLLLTGGMMAALRKRPPAPPPV